jgi:flagellar biogenesis protein FliO
MVVSLFDDPVVLGLIVVLVLFVFFGYLLMRRTVMGLREGYEDGQRRD